MTVTDPPPTEQPTTITGHARCRWATRTPISDPVALRRAWSKGLDVEAPEVNGEAVRLYPPHDLLLVKRDGVLRTVLKRTTAGSTRRATRSAQGVGVSTTRSPATSAVGVGRH